MQDYNPPPPPWQAAPAGSLTHPENVPRQVTLRGSDPTLQTAAVAMQTAFWYFRAGKPQMPLTYNNMEKCNKL